MAQPDTDGKRKWVYAFSPGAAEGGADMAELLGGKGANLAEMARLALPVPPGFTITTDVCDAFFAAGNTLPEAMKAEVMRALDGIGEMVDARFGDEKCPLLVSVRSGSRASMPGMMDTILNLGLNDQTVEGLARLTGDSRFAFDSYRRFIQMYGDVVLGVDHGAFEDILENFKNLNGFAADTDLDEESWREIIADYKAAIEREYGAPFPQDTNEQLWGAIAAVFGSWHNPRAKTYRRLHDIPDDWGTAVTVQAMVFGNLGDNSATGVAFTRNPSNGEKDIFGEYLPNAQGEDVVAGIRTPQPLTRKGAGEASESSLEVAMPHAFGELVQIFEQLEHHYRDMQDIEFTVQLGKLWILQTRAGKRTTEAALKIAVDFAADGLISRDEAILRIEPAQLDQLLHPAIDPGAEHDLIARGLPASPGAASGELVFHSEMAEALKAKGRDVILVRSETSPEDVHGMHAAVGILTARGGMTSHAAVVARGMGRPCVSGAGTLRIDANAGTMRAGARMFKSGDIISIDGSTGRVYAGKAKMLPPSLSGTFGTMMEWADEARRMKVRTNADTPRDAKQARIFGAEGIGLCRTEHMFFEESRILAVREMICAEDQEGRQQALDKLLPVQRADFEELFEIMAGLPITIRLLDPPLHEFLPHEDREAAQVAAALGMDLVRLKTRVAELEEFNPMLGFRGCRLGIKYPEITRMQVRAIFEAAVNAQKKTGNAVRPEVMVPFIGYRREFDILRAVIVETAEAVKKETGITIPYDVGTMIELPRAALLAAEIADGELGADFFSFGTNDLTQTALGLSRDDAAPILSNYLEHEVITTDPFVSLDLPGVGELVKIGVDRGRSVKPDIKTGICGEHGGDSKSIAFFEDIGLDYVSCSPFRVPIARLSAAQATIRRRLSGKAS
ncbi:pyruvate, phosphate dikinase [Hyphomicrobium methylovorum]|uniref:pyruvate, phosphate dikinase n=1 Tax=Hyphomicrobium methylovorum TaxID=84 RepID=UPI0015E6EE26|nr:pyruvate, phosphate dikinase [Hyphomicrobium methylovorum]MBA2127273.1 pyruvate, phosphate dikinase [Hyphomicrobium methylovorum]